MTSNRKHGNGNMDRPLTNKTDRLKLDQYFRLSTLYYNLLSSCIVNIVDCSKHYPSENTRNHYRLSWFYVTLPTPQCVSMTSTSPHFSPTAPPLPPMSGWRWPRVMSVSVVRLPTHRQRCSRRIGEAWAPWQSIHF